MTRKETVPTVNKVLEPSPLKEHRTHSTSRKRITQRQRNENHNPSEFHQPEVRRHTNGDVFEMCAVTKIPGTHTTSGHILSQPTLFTTTDLAERYMGQRGQKGFLLEKPAHEDHATLQSTLSNLSQTRHTLLHPFPTHSSGQTVTCFWAILRGAHQAGHTRVFICLTWSQCA